ncbi:MAG: response regulator transcription factor [Verrucomicrobia bacterium]|nr:response regulator transcription factor [Verrucomicrobiota bacterium]
MNARRAPRRAPPHQRILLVDDHPLMREGAANWINREPDLEVCWQAANAVEALKLLRQQRPALVVTDLSMSGRNGIELIKDMRALHPGVPILVLSMHDESLYASRALRAGAAGYVMKEAGGEKLVAAVRQVLRGGIYVNPRVTEEILGTLVGRRPRNPASPIVQLSDREFEVFGLIGRGCDTCKIAAQLHLSPRTVDVHRANIKRKLGLVNSTALVHRAVHWLETEQRSG